MLLEQQEPRKEDKPLNGYYTSYGFMGLVNGEYLLFATDTEYYEFIADD
jgi:hypothetical protein